MSSPALAPDSGEVISTDSASTAARRCRQRARPRANVPGRRDPAHNERSRKRDGGRRGSRRIGYFTVPRTRPGEAGARCPARGVHPATGTLGLTMRRPPRSGLTAGQQRLLAVARALATGAELLIFDEPGAGLNAAEKAFLAEVIRKSAPAAGPSCSWSMTCTRRPPCRTPGRARSWKRIAAGLPDECGAISCDRGIPRQHGYRRWLVPGRSQAARARAPLLEVDARASATAARPRSAVYRSASRNAASSHSWERTAPASPPCSRHWPARSARLGRILLAGETSAGCRRRCA